MTPNNWASLRPLIFVFLILNTFLIAGKSWLVKKGLDQDVLIAGNLLLFGVSLLSFILTRRSLRSDNPHVFVRAIYTSFIVKFFVLAAGAFIYISVAGAGVSKASLFSSMGLYAVYTFLEVSALLRLLKQKKNA